MKRTRLDLGESNSKNEGSKRNCILTVKSDDDLWEDDSDCMFTQDDLQMIEEQEMRIVAENSSLINTRNNSAKISTTSTVSTNLPSNDVYKSTIRNYFNNNQSDKAKNVEREKRETACCSSKNNVVYEENKTESVLFDQIVKLQDENKLLREEQFAMEGHITMMKATLSSKDEEIKQLFEDKMQKEKLFALEKVEIDKKYNLEMQKLQSQLLFEVKEKADEQDSYRRLLQKQQQQHDASCIIPPTQDCGYLGKSRGVSCSPKKQKSLSSPVKRLSVINKPSSKLSLDSKSGFPNVQSFLQEKPFYNEVGTMTTFDEVDSSSHNSKVSKLSTKFQKKLSVCHSKEATFRKDCLNCVIDCHLLNMLTSYCSVVHDRQLISNTSSESKAEAAEVLKLANHGLQFIMNGTKSKIGAIYLLPAVELCLAQIFKSLSLALIDHARVHYKSKKRESRFNSARSSSASSPASQVAISQKTKDSNAQTTDCNDSEKIATILGLLQLLELLVEHNDCIAFLITGFITSQSATLTEMSEVSSKYVNTAFCLQYIQRLGLIDLLLKFSNSLAKNRTMASKSLNIINVLIKLTGSKTLSFQWCEGLFTQQTLVNCFFTEEHDELPARALDILLSLSLSTAQCPPPQFCRTSSGGDCIMLALYNYCFELKGSSDQVTTSLNRMFELLKVLLTTKKFGPVILLQADCLCSNELMKMLVIKLWRLTTVAMTPNVVQCIRQGVRLVHDLILRDVHWLQHKEDIAHYFNDLCIVTERIFIANNFGDDLRVLAKICDMKDTAFAEEMDYESTASTQPSSKPQNTNTVQPSNKQENAHIVQSSNKHESIDLAKANNRQSNLVQISIHSKNSSANHSSHIKHTNSKTSSIEQIIVID